jgi:hypothetical protein
MQPETARNGPRNGILTPCEESAALLLARGFTSAEAAAACGAGEGTMKAWVTGYRLASIQPQFAVRVE